MYFSNLKTIRVDIWTFINVLEIEITHLVKKLTKASKIFICN